MVISANEHANELAGLRGANRDLRPNKRLSLHHGAEELVGDSSVNTVMLCRWRVWQR